MWNIVEPYRPHDSMAHMKCVLDNCGYKHVLRMCNPYCFCMATVVTPTRLIVNVYKVSCSLPVLCKSVSLFARQRNFCLQVKIALRDGVFGA